MKGTQVKWQCIVLFRGNLEDGEGKDKVFLRLVDGQKIPVQDFGHHYDRTSLLFMLRNRGRLFSQDEPSWFWCYPQTIRNKTGVCIAVNMHEPPKDDTPVGILRFRGILKKDGEAIAVWIGRQRSKSGHTLNLQDPQALTGKIDAEKVVEGTATYADGAWQINSCQVVAPPKPVPKKRVPEAVVSGERPAK